MKNYVNRIPKIIIYKHLFLLCFISCKGQSEISLKQGVYDNGSVVVLHNNVKLFSGVINLQEDINCKLFFYGSAVDNKNSRISIYNPVDASTSSGYISYSENEIIIKSDLVLFPCQRILDLSSGESFSYSNKLDFNNCLFSLVKSEKSFLYSKPTVLTKKKSYLIKDDIVVVCEKKDKWIKIKYLAKKNIFFWIKAEDLILPPRWSEHR
jgi:hypothetical protein